MIMATASTALLGVGAWCCYRSHPNQRFAATPLPHIFRLIGYVLLVISVVCWVQVAGWRAGLAIAAIELMLLFSALPMLSLLRRAAP